MSQEKGFKRLKVWEEAHNLTLLVYRLSNDFPKSKIFGLTSQLRRAAVSIPSNIAEGSKRNTPKDQHQFYAIAYGSGAETETQLEISKELFPHLKDKMVILENDINEIMKMLNKLRNS